MLHYQQQNGSLKLNMIKNIFKNKKQNPGIITSGFSLHKNVSVTVTENIACFGQVKVCLNVECNYLLIPSLGW